MVDPESGAPRRALVAATASDADRLKTKGNKIGDLIFARMTKPRNPGFHRLAHAIGKLAVENIPEFSHLDAHTALKRLQIESGAGCDALSVEVMTIWPAVVQWVDQHLGRPMAVMLNVVISEMKIGNTLIPILVPRSLSYDSMDEIEFNAAVKGICRYIALRYWPTVDADQIEEMAQAMKDLTT
jgi:hypothetical protein